MRNIFLFPFLFYFPTFLTFCGFCWELIKFVFGLWIKDKNSQGDTNPLKRSHMGPWKTLKGPWNVEIA
ncbi:hypothetical protein ACN38_g3879 [Penicillium nordicum]|uniref:Uncharacterized protein n=1 Tax=Penicillium nordicum TaxID=229535 RepID=A0A0N0RZB3_9EURO|nr:hypothetical protein ACN38_g3879 [Penicillium nordicum]